MDYSSLTVAGVIVESFDSCHWLSDAVWPPRAASPLLLQRAIIRSDVVRLVTGCTAVAILSKTIEIIVPKMPPIIPYFGISFWP